MGFGPIVFAVAAVLLLGLLSRDHWLKPRSGISTESPIDILARRFANGEINATELEHMKHTINELQTNLPT